MTRTIAGRTLASLGIYTPVSDKAKERAQDRAHAFRQERESMRQRSPGPLRFLGSRACGLGMLAVLLLLALSGCGSLPPNTGRTASYAQAPSASNPLVQLAQELRREQKSEPQANTAFVLLDTPESAYAGRLALVQRATRTLDLQYYAIHADPSAHALLQAIRDAAGRGVRVRILLDDFNSQRDDAQLLQLAFLPHVEMRLFNPLPGGHGLGGMRVLFALPNLSRLQRRMHNKLFLADNVLGIAGGRNLGDTYFGQSGENNFADLDVLAMGALVQEMSASFDQYWNHELAYPVQTLLSASDKQALRAGAPLPANSRRRKRRDEIAPANTPAPSAPATTPDSSLQAHAPAEGSAENRRAAHGAADDAAPPQSLAQSTEPAADLPQPMPLRQANWVWADASLLADQPSKFVLGAQDPHPTVVDQLLDWMQGAQQDVLIVSPYFVPNKQMVALFRKLRQRGVRVRVLTNSLASNDAPIAHVGYARQRRKLLKMGVELYEMQAERRQRTLRNTFGSSGKAYQASLHAKVIVVDQTVLSVGSMNLDARSHHSNSEVALKIHSPALARTIAEQIEAVLAHATWRVTLNAQRRLQWHTPDGQGPVVNQVEPNANALLQLLLKMIAPFTPDDLL